MFYSVIPAGGSGTRLWPLSRAGHPKYLLPLAGTDRTLVQATVDRLLPLSPSAAIYAVTGAAQAAALARQVPEVPAGNILVEPSPRDSCAAIGLAAAVLAEHTPGAVMGVFPADHLIPDAVRFVDVVRSAVATARQGYLTTIGISPVRPETGLGYLRTGEAVNDAAVLTEEFKEKPSHATAVAYLESGRYLWNAGMFVWQVETFLDELARQKPAMHAALTKIATAWDTPARDGTLAAEWSDIEKISVDYAVMEGAAAAGRVATVPADFAWSDIGDFHALGEALPTDAAGNLVVGDPASVLTHDVADSVLVPRSGRLVAALGVRDLVVVDTPDAVLVCPRDRAQDVKKLVDELRGRGDSALL